MLSMHEALGSIASTSIKNKNRKSQNQQTKNLTEPDIPQVNPYVSPTLIELLLVPEGPLQ